MTDFSAIQAIQGYNPSISQINRQSAKTYQTERNPFGAPTSFQGQSSLQQELNEVYQIGASKKTADGLGGFGGETETTGHKLSLYA